MKPSRRTLEAGKGTRFTVLAWEKTGALSHPCTRRASPSPDPRSENLPVRPRTGGVRASATSRWGLLVFPGRP
jgi:hypothetical protein